jgi:hypothetical protein
MPLVCVFCPRCSDPQAAPINAGRFGLIGNVGDHARLPTCSKLASNNTNQKSPLHEIRPKPDLTIALFLIVRDHNSGLLNTTSLHHVKNWLNSINSVVTKVIAIGKKAAIGVP